MITIRRIRTGEGELYRDLRLAALKDAPHAFCTRYEDALERPHESWIKQADEAATGHSQSIFIVFDDAIPSGLAAIYGNDKSHNEAEVFQVWLSPQLRGSGIGRQLMDTIFKWAKGVGFERIFASITYNNAALSFYSKYGFTRYSASSGETKMFKETT